MFANADLRKNRKNNLKKKKTIRIGVVASRSTLTKGKRGVDHSTLQKCWVGESPLGKPMRHALLHMGGESS